MEMTLADRAIQAYEEEQNQTKVQEEKWHDEEEQRAARQASEHVLSVLGSIFSGENLTSTVWDVLEVWPERERITAYGRIGDILFCYQQYEDYYTTVTTLHAMETCPKCHAMNKKLPVISTPARLGEALKSTQFEKHRVAGTETETGWATYCNGEAQEIMRGDVLKPETPKLVLTNAEEGLISALRAAVAEYVLGDREG